jgi:hypothetical protein
MPPVHQSMALRRPTRGHGNGLEVRTVDPHTDSEKAALP